jgi:O-antigen/teichoic acid export membrane protein
LSKRSFTGLFGVALLAALWSAAVQLAVTPLYLRRLGVEAYGLIGFYVTLQAVLALFDAGVSITVSRDVAKLITEQRIAAARDLVRTFEAVYWCAGVAIGGALALGAPWIASTWLQRSSLPMAEVRRALVLMALLWIAQWLAGYYQAAMIGMERIVAVNLLRIAALTLQHGGTALLLITRHIGPAAVFGYQSIVVAVYALVLAVAFWRGVPSDGGPARVTAAVLRERWRFTFGIAAMTIAGTMLAQGDKVILSHLLPLDVFGRYSLAALMATAALLAVVPLFNVLLPRLTSLVASLDRDAVAELYRYVYEVVAVIAISPAAFVIVFGRDVIALWTGMPELAARTAPIAALLIGGSALNALLTPPYALQLAHGRTRAWLWLNAVQLVVFLPLVTILALRGGVVAAAIAWPVVQGGALAVAVPMTERSLLRWPGATWLRDVVPPAIAAFAFAILARVVMPAPALAPLVVIALLTAATAALAAPRVRAMLRPRG